MANTWIVVAESARARIYNAPTPKAELEELEDLIHTEARMHDRDLISDRPGADSGASGEGRHVLDERTPAHVEQAQHFAHEVVERLQQGHDKGQYERLILIAPPKFLGMLRDVLPKTVAGRVVEEIDKNLVQHSAEEVRQHVQSLL